MMNHRRPDKTVASWRKSTFSLGNGACIEVANIEYGDGVVVRDSKNPEGMNLVYHPASWNRFVGELKAA
jgi:hypothetical protein